MITFTTKIDEVGTVYTYNASGQLHSFDDRPAIVYESSGAQYWYKNGKLHRDRDKPAVIDREGAQYWYKNGKFHREGDKPAIVYSDGKQLWFKNDKQYTPQSKTLLTGKIVVIDGNKYILTPCTD